MIGNQLVRAGEVIQPKRGIVPFKDTITFRNRFTAKVMRIVDHVKINGIWVPERKMVFSTQGYNEITIVGKNHLLDVVFGNSTPVTQIDPWYVGLIDQSPTPTTSENDTSASHAGWAENTDYAGNRKEWDDTNSASKVKGTNTVSTFVIDTTAEIHGIFIDSLATTTAGILWASGSFDSSLNVVNTDELKITYGIRT
jgi:hypothetical protein